MTERMNLDAPPSVSPADAITLMVHHLALAAMYFEATPDDIGVGIDEINDMLGNPANLAAIAWLNAIHEAYEKFKTDEL